MLKRLLIIGAILAGLATLVITQTHIRSKIERIAVQRDQNARAWELETAARLKTQALLAEKEAALAGALKSAAEIGAQRDEAQTSLERERLAGLALRKELQEAQNEKSLLARALDLTKEAPAKLARAEAVNATLTVQNAALAQRVRELEDVVGPYPPPPADLKANVVTVDPKWGFVVLDIGKTQRAKPTWNLLVTRAGTLVGKVEITTVLENRCIANVLPGWSLGQIQEGDQVIPEIRVSHLTGPAR